MIEIPQSIMEDVFAHARECAPDEACGLLVDVDGTLCIFRAVNVCAEPSRAFVIDPATYARAKKVGRLAAVYHSHPNGSPQPSIPDQILRDDPRRERLPYLIVAPHLGTHTLTEPMPMIPALEGRPWVAGALDCYAVVRDYWAEHGVEMPDPFRGDWNYEEDWRESKRSPFLDYVQQARLVNVPRQTMREGDILLFRWLFDVEHHVGVYLGNNMFLHHPMEQLSRSEVYGEVWQRRLASVWRHEAMMRPGDPREA